MEKSYFRAVIVDDEPIILKGLVETYDWEAYGITIIGYYNDSVKALNEIKKLSPDIVIADIKMPNLNGLELIKEIRLLFDDVIFVVVSAYKDFDYAKRACDLNVFHYLIKPFDNEIFKETMIKLHDHCQMGKKRREGQLKYISIVEENKYNVEVLLFRDFIEKTIEYRELERSLKELNSEVLLSREYCVLISEVDILEIALNNTQISKQHLIIEKIIKQELQEYFEIHMVRLFDGSIVTVIYKPNHVAFYVGKINILIEEVLECEVVNVVSEVSNDLASLRELVWNIIYPFKKKKNKDGFEKKYYPYHLELQIIKSLENSDKQQLKSSCSQLFVFLNQQDKNDIVIYMRQLNISIIKFLSDMSIYTKDIKEIFRVFEIKLERYSLDKLLRALEGILDKIIDHRINIFPKGELKITDDYISMAIRYIAKNISDENLSMKTISEVVHLNPVYFGRVFKNQTGMSFRSYLLKERIELAKKILSENDKSILEVCSEVGISNPSYFSKVFKDFTGVIPSKYYIDRS